MKHSSVFLFCSLLLGVASSSELSADCISTHLLPIITTSSSAPVLTELAPGAMPAVPTPGANKAAESGSEPVSGLVNPSNASPASVEPDSPSVGVLSIKGSGYVNPTDTVPTPSSSASPDYVSGAPDNIVSNISRAMYLAGSISLIVHLAGLV
ncbi:uncharacterized protein FTJAE_13876 [Fusarium tjaetaba]|uniref:Uncharacterized protein n=1 Tax=Fusarium tjaetaba TaxID=1567544 RepID=A0A8H5QE20_9HYPO|nr:uncharacterized protein FTJAE_13876 [Fusarium tjaetaba]KAF5613665.1 hypothetical protein FTJAE_13876 [Fusarium tjaetaba]